VESTASSLLALLGLAGDPLQSREHLFLAHLLRHAWSEGRDLDLPGIIELLQHPPFDKIGVMPLDTLFAEKDRVQLALRLNHLLASPGFDLWLQGAPLDPASLLHDERGRPRVAIFSIAHLGDAERMFFVSLLLNQMLGWMRAQNGTTSLRALLYMDEIFGFLPPTPIRRPKRPMMTLLKQARAFGLGCLLATQNPVDLDYKALSNIGTWFLGRLQTERDKLRVLDGLEGCRRIAGREIRPRRTMETLISGLGNRVFLMNNVHEDGPVFFETRWVMLPPDADPAGLVYEPRVLRAGRVLIEDAKLGVSFTDERCELAPVDGARGEADWALATPFDPEASSLSRLPVQGPGFLALPKPLAAAAAYTALKRAFADELARAGGLELLHHPALGEVSLPGECERDFRLRLVQKAREIRDERVQALRDDFARRIAREEADVTRAEAALEREKAQATSAKWNAMASAGSALLGALFGRKKLTATNIRRVGSAGTSMNRSVAQAGDVARAEEKLAAERADVSRLEEELRAAIDTLERALDPVHQPLESIRLKPLKKNIVVTACGLAWVPIPAGA
jgi:hypothetical protein